MELYQSQQTKQPLSSILDQQIEIAETYIENQKFSEAVQTFRNLLDYDLTESMRFDVFKNLGNTFLKCGDIESAEENYNKAYRIFPANPALTINYGVLEIQKGNLTGAKEKFIEVLAKDDESDLAWVGLALVHRGHADFDLSRSCMLRALDSNPKNKTALVQYYKWCREDDVASDLKKVEDYLSTKPNDQEILNLLNQYNA